MHRSLLVLAVSVMCVVSASAKHTPAESASHVATVDGMKVHYESHGVGREGIVFVHGWTCDLTSWNEQIPAFAAKTRTIAIDLPGHGQSDAPKTTYSMDLFARAIDGVMRDAGVDRAVLVGHSMGTPVIRQFYRQHPEKTLALVVVDGALRRFADRATMEQMIAPLRGPSYKDVAGKMIDGMLAPMKDASRKEAIKAKMLATPQYVAVSAFEGMGDDAIWKDDTITVPVLAIMSKSPYYPADMEAQYRAVAPDLEFESWDGVSHFLMIDDPARFNDTIAGYLVKKKLLGFGTAGVSPARP